MLAVSMELQKAAMIKITGNSLEIRTGYWQKIRVLPLH
jgi:hypothetical protein